MTTAEKEYKGIRFFKLEKVNMYIYFTNAF